MLTRLPRFSFSATACSLFFLIQLSSGQPGDSKYRVCKSAWEDHAGNCGGNKVSERAKTGTSQSEPQNVATCLREDIAEKASPCKNQSSTPNILVVVLDDVGWAGLKGYNNGASGNQYAHTPNFDAAVAEGIRLKNLYVQPMCSPTRAAMLTGRYPHRYGAQTFVQRPYQSTFLPQDETTLADKLLAAGYSTALVGKWHLGYGRKKYTPTSRGFQRFFGSYEVGGDHYNHTVGPNTHALGQLFTLPEGVQQTLDLHRESSITGREEDRVHEFVTTERGVYSSHMLSREAAKEINRAATLPHQPLFLYLAYTTIHTPLEVDRRYIDMNAHMEGSHEIRVNAGMMSAMDEGFGIVVNALKTNEMWDDTVILLFSDNGALVYQGASNYPLRGMKMGPFEGGIRSVAMITGGHPDVRRAAGSESRAMLHAVDIHTIVLHLAGADPNYSNAQYPPKNLDAMSGAALWKSIVGDENASPRTEFIVLLDELGQFPSLLRTSNYVLLGKCSAIRSGKYKLIVGRPGRDDWFPTDPGKCFQSLVHEGAIFDVPNDHKDCIRGDFNYEHALAKDKRGLPVKEVWLFDIENDPEERHDLSSSHPEIVTRLKGRLAFEHANSVPSLPDRWDSLVGMMRGIFHQPNPGGGYEAGLTTWQEPDHLRKVGFFRRAWHWIRISTLSTASKLAGIAQTHETQADSIENGDNFDHNEMEKMDEAMRLALGLDHHESIPKEEMLKLIRKLSALEASLMSFRAKM